MVRSGAPDDVVGECFRSAGRAAPSARVMRDTDASAAAAAHDRRATRAAGQPGGVGPGPGQAESAQGADGVAALERAVGVDAGVVVHPLVGLVVGRFVVDVVVGIDPRRPSRGRSWRRRRIGWGRIARGSVGRRWCGRSRCRRGGRDRRRRWCHRCGGNRQLGDSGGSLGRCHGSRVDTWVSVEEGEPT